VYFQGRCSFLLIYINSAEPVRQRITNLIVDTPEDIPIDLTDPAKPSSHQEIAVTIEILRLLKVGKDIIFLIDKGAVESPGPKGNISEVMPSLVCIIVQVVDPGAIYGAHTGNEVIDRRSVESIFMQRVLHPVLPDPEFINVGKGICRQFQGDPLERSVGEFDGKRFMSIGAGIH
jgi:hypothetical protein